MDLISAIEAGRQAARQREEDAYVKSRRPIENAFNDQSAQLGIDAQRQGITLRESAEGRAAAAEGRAVAQEGRTEEEYNEGKNARAFALSSNIVGFLADQRAQNPAMDFNNALSSVPPQYLEQAGLSTPEAQAAFVQRYSGQSPDQMKQEALWFGGPDPIKDTIEVVNKETGEKEVMFVRQSGKRERDPSISLAPKPTSSSGFTIGDTRYTPDGQVIVSDPAAIQRTASARAEGGVVGKAEGGETVATGPAAQRKADSILRQGAVKLNELKGNISTALKQTSEWSAGLAAHGAKVGGQPANLAATLQSIGARIGLDALQDLKSQGVTLGQVTEAEHALLQSLVGNLSQIQDPAELKRALANIETHAANMWRLAEMDYQAMFGKAPPPMSGDPAGTPAAAPTSAYDKYSQYRQ